MIKIKKIISVVVIHDDQQSECDTSPLVTPTPGSTCDSTYDCVETVIK